MPEMLQRIDRIHTVVTEGLSHYFEGLVAISYVTIASRNVSAYATNTTALAAIGYEVGEKNGIVYATARGQEHAEPEHVRAQYPSSLAIDSADIIVPDGYEAARSLFIGMPGFVEDHAKDGGHGPYGVLTAHFPGFTVSATSVLMPEYYGWKA